MMSGRGAVNVFALALAATLALGTLAATAAYAEEEGHFTAAQNEIDVSALVTANDEKENLVFEKEGGSIVVCDKDVFHSELIGGTASVLTVEPTFGGSNQPGGDGRCEADSLPATIEENGCHLELYTLETDPGAADWRSLSRITDCDGGESGGIEIRVFAGEAHGFEVCNILIPEQGGLEGVTATTEVTSAGLHDLTIGVDIQDQIAYTQTVLCGHEAGLGSLTGALTMSATNAATGEDADLTIKHPA